MRSGSSLYVSDRLPRHISCCLSLTLSAWSPQTHCNQCKSFYLCNITVNKGKINISVHAFVWSKHCSAFRFSFFFCAAISAPQLHALHVFVYFSFLERWELVFWVLNYYFTVMIPSTLIIKCYEWSTLSNGVRNLRYVVFISDVFHDVRSWEEFASFYSHNVIICLSGVMDVSFLP